MSNIVTIILSLLVSLGMYIGFVFGLKTKWGKKHLCIHWYVHPNAICVWRVIIGLIGAVLGFGLGTGLALKFGPAIFKVTASMITPQIQLFYWAAIASPAVCALAVFIPAMTAVAQDPAVILREE